MRQLPSRKKKGRKSARKTFAAGTASPIRRALSRRSDFPVNKETPTIGIGAFIDRRALPMLLYHLTLHQPTAISLCASGSFCGGKSHDLAVVRGNSVLEICTPDPATGKLLVLHSQNVFCKIRSILPFRPIGSTKDLLVVGTDSGAFVLLNFLPEKRMLEKVHQEAFGKSGTRRIVPGQYLAVDPKGRAALIGAVEKTKLVYVLNRDSQNRVTISSPLEASKSKIITCATVGMDVGWENPLFASLELDYSECEEIEDAGCHEKLRKFLVLYELDLGLNHVVRRWSCEVSGSANLLVGLPGGPDGPGGVLVCWDGAIGWIMQGKETVSMPIPRASSSDLAPERPILISGYAVHRSKSMFFVLLHSEEGDLFKVSLDTGEDGQVTKIRLVYFDSVPPGIAICLTKNGFLFVSGRLYQIQKLADSAPDSECWSSDSSPNTFQFRRRSEFENIALIDERQNLAPITDARLQPKEASILVTTGTGADSKVAVLRHGLRVFEIASTQLPLLPTGVWSLRSSRSEAVHSLLILSFSTSTISLTVGETIEETKETYLQSTSRTIAIFSMFDDSLVQVTPTAIRHVKLNKTINDWTLGGQKIVTHATANECQVVVALDNSEILYFEINALGDLFEAAQRRIVPLGIECISIGNLSETAVKFPFLAVGCKDQTCRLVRLGNAENWLEMISLQAFQDKPSSLLMSRMVSGDFDSLFLHVGLQNGEYFRVTVDLIAGNFIDCRSQSIDEGRVSLAAANSGRAAGCALILASKALLAVPRALGTVEMVPILFPKTVQSAAYFSSDQFADGFATLDGNSLTIYGVEELCNSLELTESIPCRFTAKKLSLSSSSPLVAVVESDHHACLPITTHQASQASVDNQDQDAMAISDDEDDKAETPREDTVASLPSFGHPAGCWASRIQICDLDAMKSVQEIVLANSYLPLASCFVEFASCPGRNFLIVSAVQDFKPLLRSFSQCALFAFRQALDGSVFYPCHVTPTEDLTLAMVPFHGMLAVGIGSCLRLVDMGKQKLLRKCEIRHLPNQIAALNASGSRIFVGDAHSGALFLHYKREENQFVVFADDPLPHHVSSFAQVDFNTVAIGDKFGNFSVRRLSKALIEQFDQDPSFSRISEKPLLLGAPHKTAKLVEFHVGETMVSLMKGQLSASRKEAVFFATILGRVGMLAPFSRKEEFAFLQQLEAAVRSEAGNVLGRDHLAYRSSFAPAEAVVDGDLCECFFFLPPEKRASIAEALGVSAADICSRLENFRHLFAF